MSCIRDPNLGGQVSPGGAAPLALHGLCMTGMQAGFLLTPGSTHSASPSSSPTPPPVSGPAGGGAHVLVGLAMLCPRGCDR